jgi:hypothetical protein
VPNKHEKEILTGPHGREGEQEQNGKTVKTRRVGWAGGGERKGRDRRELTAVLLSLSSHRDSRDDDTDNKKNF